MKITRRQLRRLINEELNRFRINETAAPLELPVNITGSLQDLLGDLFRDFTAEVMTRSLSDCLKLTFPPEPPDPACVAEVALEVLRDPKFQKKMMNEAGQAVMKLLMDLAGARGQF